ncbi:hypothetical protein [Desulfitobacterium sp. AusDCA]|uniref:hypothetical protein n=1 Tax=Desulfitobacterium sp. AusDCA TaxID=3240383 RepID=UPI003DA73A05
MSSYFYVTILCVAIVLEIILEIYLFNKGKYYPYLNWNKEDSLKKRIFDIGFVIVVLVSVSILNSSHTELPIYILLLPLIVLIFCISILNYLSYMKIKDPKIIRQTVIVDLSVIALFALFVFTLMIRNINPY